jgi:nanoRNase/pAp phosphatase (c-di-AMP/oligoRNAs hydrolase)
LNGIFSRIIENPIDQSQLKKLRSAAGTGPVLILTHDNPDPDALASGKALAYLLEETWALSTRLVYSGLVARSENQAMLNILTPEWEHAETLNNLDDYSAIALVDTQPGAGNNRLPDLQSAEIVIDHHHPLREGLDTVPYIDMRPDVGATVSLLYQHLEAAEIWPDSDLATALFYGLQTDTQGLSRGASALDQSVYFDLLGLLDRDKLIQVERAGLSRDYFRAFSLGLRAARTYEHSIVADMGKIHRPDFPAEIADLLIRLKDARAALSLGYLDQTLYFSLRSKLSGMDAGLLVQEIIVSPGKGGGHGTMAGGQVHLTSQEYDDTAREIINRFLKIMDEKGEGELLLN